MISNIDVCTSDNYFTKNTPKVIIMDFNDLISIDTESLFDLLDLPQVVDNDFTSKKFLVGLVGTSGDQVQPPCCSWVSHSRLHRKGSRQVFNVSRGASTTSRHLVAVLCHPQCKDCFLHMKKKSSYHLLCSNLCSLTLALLLHTIEKSLSPST